MNIETVKISGDGYLINGTISVPKADGNRDYQAVKKWIDNPKNVVGAEFTASQLEEKAVVQAKQDIADALEVLTVETTAGNVFDATLEARQNLADAILASDFLKQTEAVWRLADNTEVLITLDELKEAHALALQKYAVTKAIGA